MDSIRRIFITFFFLIFEFDSLSLSTTARRVGAGASLPGRRNNTSNVAVCFSGHLRSFLDINHLIHQNLIKSLQDHSKGVVDVFAVIPLGVGAKEDDDEGLQAFRSSFNPIYISIVSEGVGEEEEKEEEEKTSSFVAPKRNYPPHLSRAQEQDELAHLARTHSMSTSSGGHEHGEQAAAALRAAKRTWDRRWERSTQAANEQYQNVARCFDLVRSHEEEEETKSAIQRGGSGQVNNKFNYAWVVRARFDAAWVRVLPPLHTFASDRVWVPDTPNGVNDQFALVPRHLAEVYFGAWVWLFDKRENEGGGGVEGRGRGEKGGSGGGGEGERNKGGKGAGNGGVKETSWWAPRIKWQPESMLWRYLFLHHVQFGRFSVPMVLVREERSLNQEQDQERHLLLHGSECTKSRLSWPLLLHFLELLVVTSQEEEEEEHSQQQQQQFQQLQGGKRPGGMSITDGLKRAQTASCIRSLASITANTATPADAAAASAGGGHETKVLFKGLYSKETNLFDWGTALLARRTEGGRGNEQAVQSLVLELPTTHDGGFDPLKNFNALESFCATHGFELSCDLLQQRLWKMGVTLPPPLPLTVEGEVAWVVTALMDASLHLETMLESSTVSVGEEEQEHVEFSLESVDRRRKANHLSPATIQFEVVVPEHDDSEERKLHPPSVQHVNFTAVQARELVQSCLCIYLSMLGLKVQGGGGMGRRQGMNEGVVEIDGFDGVKLESEEKEEVEASDWPSEDESQGCELSLHNLEQFAMRALDAHLLTRATWGGEHGDIYFVRLLAPQ